MRFVAKLEPEEPYKTRVTVLVQAPTESPYGNMDQRLKDHKEITNLYLTAMNEQVASRLEGGRSTWPKLMARSPPRPRRIWQYLAANGRWGGRRAQARGSEYPQGLCRRSVGPLTNQGDRDEL